MTRARRSGLCDVAASFVATWAHLLRDRGVLLLLVAAPVFYAFFYPWPYSKQVVTGVPVIIVDLDGSSLSRQIMRLSAASPRLDLRGITGDEQIARRALLRGDILGYAVLPRDLKRHAVRGESAVVEIVSNGAYALLNKTVLSGFSEAVGVASAGVEIRQLQSREPSLAQAQARRSPVNLQMVALFNPTEGYGSFVVPAVVLLILQQTLLMGVAMLVGTWAEQGRLRTGASDWAGRLLALCSVGWLSGLFYFGWVFLWQDFPGRPPPAGALALLLCYVPAVCALGAALGAWFGNRERALQVLLFTALPLAFVAGFSWPSEALPQPLQVLRWLAPSTAGIQASLRLNQMGAPVRDVLPLLGVLLLLTLGALASLAVLQRRHRPSRLKSPASNPVR